MDDLDALEALLAKATPGPWRTTAEEDENGVVRPMIKGWRQEPMGLYVAAFFAYADEGQGGDDNARLVVAAVNALPTLLAELRRLRGVEEKARAEIKQRDAFDAWMLAGADDQDELPNPSSAWAEAEAALRAALEQ